MADSVFDIDNFMDTKVTQATSDEYILIPEGEWKVYTLAGVVRMATTDEGQTPVLDMPFRFIDQAVKDEVGRDDPQLTFGMFLTVDAKTGKLSDKKGDNVKLGQLRTALKQNDAKKPWAPSMLSNKGPLKVRVKHTTATKGPNKGTTYANIVAVTAAR